MARPRFAEFEKGRRDISISISEETMDELLAWVEDENGSLSALVRLLIVGKLEERRRRLARKAVRASLRGSQPS
jgi:hypothetical protein